MSEKDTFRAGNVSKRLNIHQNTVRGWAAQYARFMSAGATAPRKEYTESDIRVLATINKLRNLGIKHEEIEAALEAGQLVDDIPDVPPPEVEEARRQINLVPLAQLERALDQIQVLQSEIDRLIEERDSARINAAQANERIAEYRQQIGELRGRLAMVRYTIIAVFAAVAVTVIVVLLLLAQAP